MPLGADLGGPKELEVGIAFEEGRLEIDLEEELGLPDFFWKFGWLVLLFLL